MKEEHGAEAAKLVRRLCETESSNERARNHAALDRHVIFHAELLHQPGQPIRREAAHDVVLEGDDEARCAGVTLAP